MDGVAADFVFNTNGWTEYSLMAEGICRPGYIVPRKLDPAGGASHMRWACSECWTSDISY